MCTVNEFKKHFSRAVDTVFIAVGGTKLGMTAERDKFKNGAVETAVQGAAIRGIPAVYHFFNFSIFP